MTREPEDKPFKRRRILPAYQELLASGALKGGTDSAQIISEDRDSETRATTRVAPTPTTDTGDHRP
jgi:hypothetical protein